MMTLRPWLIGGGIAAGIAAAALFARPAPPDDPFPPAALAMIPSFAEEFDGPRLDPARWTLAYHEPAREPPTIAKRNLWNNGELQVYFDRDFLDLGIDPFRQRGGTLTLTARPLDAAALRAVRTAIAAEPPGIRDSALQNVRYSSGMISTRGHFTQTYGYFEIRARWSGGKGVWPAFWMLPQGGGWPPELDILEAHGDKPGTAFHSTHSKRARSVTRTARFADEPEAFHRYGALWTRERIDFYIDGRKTETLVTPPDMHQPMYLIANLAIGGRWPGAPDTATRFPATMEIDYIRAWRFPAAP